MSIEQSDANEPVLHKTPQTSSTFRFFLNDPFLQQTKDALVI